jgi:hypothetical protein
MIRRLRFEARFYLDDKRVLSRGGGVRSVRAGAARGRLARRSHKKPITGMVLTRLYPSNLHRA